jgi:hypothetical protein
MKKSQKAEVNMKTAFIYHFTDGSDKRPKVYKGQRTA